MPTRGRHKIFIGMAAGVGKTYRALQDIRDRRKDGIDALIGILETMADAKRWLPPTDCLSFRV